MFPFYLEYSNLLILKMDNSKDIFGSFGGNQNDKEKENDK